MDSVFRQVLSMSVTGSVVILAILLARLLLRPFPRKYTYVLWGVAAFRLCCPVSFRWKLSLFSYIPGGSEAADPFPALGDGFDAITAPQMGVTVWQVLALLWAAGAAVMVLYSVVSYWRLRRSLRSAVRLEGNIYATDTIPSPFILGLFRPRIYIPFGMTPEARDHVLAHERSHLKRGDHIVKVLAYGLLALHWFNPLCHIAFRLMGKDMELCCDEAVLAAGSVDKKRYCETLVSVAVHKRQFTALPLTFGEGSVKSRVKNALSWRKPKVWMAVVAMALCAVIGAACAADPISDTPRLEAGEYRWVTGQGRADTVTVTGDALSYGNVSLPLEGLQWEAVPYTQAQWNSSQQLSTPLEDIESFSYMRLAASEDGSSTMFLLWKDGQLWLLQDTLMITGGELIPGGSEKDPVLLSFQAVEQGIETILKRNGAHTAELSLDNVYAQIDANKDTYRAVRSEPYVLEYICHGLLEKKVSGEEEMLLTILLGEVMDRMGEPVEPDLTNGRQWFESYVNQARQLYAKTEAAVISEHQVIQKELVFFGEYPASFYILSYLGEFQ